MSDAGGQLVGIDPPEIRFPSGGSKDETSCLVRVSNQTDDYVAFKIRVKFSHIKCYYVQPKRGILEPRSQLPVVVTRKARKDVTESDITCKDMFMLRCLRVNANTTDADAEKMMMAGGYQVKRLSVAFVSPDQPSGVASPPESSMSGTWNCSSFRHDAPGTTVFKEETSTIIEMSKLSPTTSTASVCVEELRSELLKTKSSEEHILSEGGGDDRDDQEASLLMADANCQNEEEEPVLLEGGCDDADDLLMADANCQDKAEEEPILLESGGDDADNQEANQLMADANYQDEEEKEEPFLPEGGGGSVNGQEAIPYVMNIDGNCQEEEEEPVLPEGGGCDSDHVNQELDSQNQSGLCLGHGTSDTEAQNDDRRNREEHMQSASNGGQPDIDLTLPFTKTLSFWESVESCEAFRLLPQRPHFRPLVELDPEIREQEAIKFTVGFATLVEKIAALKPDVSIGLFHHYLEQLEDLELFGFDVKAYVDRVSSLLAIQKRREQIRHRLNEVGDMITVKAGDKVKLEEGINQMDKELQEAESRQGIRRSLKQIKEARAASLELQLSIVNKKVSSAEEQFKALVSAPW